MASHWAMAAFGFPSLSGSSLCCLRQQQRENGQTRDGSFACPVFQPHGYKRPSVVVVVVVVVFFFFFFFSTSESAGCCAGCSTHEPMSTLHAAKTRHD
ncbi:hypothetical protein K431DRAFT_282215 [Polychaeton citri CBS 116435]|uniref:Uncharacterized protein n=1 Tax=Polychaeton citri CBS 116435 TaxID=1314669 RepID=A0A9P4QDE9_9PEZI|nr:hypothetical protein K431DRAFT_282215 [Polychaeton citri CBS 116435]